MSSRGKVIIGIKPKKKKKPLIKPAKTSNDVSSAIGSIGKPMQQRSSSPNTVVNTTNGGGVTKPLKKKASAGMITIKPFEKPPQIPQNFYNDSLDVLQRALICVLRHEALTSSASNNNAGN